MIRLFTDGAYSAKSKCGGIGIVFLRNDTLVGCYKRKFDYVGVTISRMELSAAIIALHCIKDTTDHIELISDSMYVIGCLTNPTWERKENKDLWNLIDKEINRIGKERISYIHVRGHKDNEYNNMADQLAVIARSE